MRPSVAKAPGSKIRVPSDSRIWLFSKSLTPGWPWASSRLRVRFRLNSVASSS